jgi:DNA replication protein DnaC
MQVINEKNIYDLLIKNNIKILTKEELEEIDREEKLKEMEELKKQLVINRFERGGLSLDLLKKINEVKDFFKINIFEDSLILGDFGVGKTWGVLKNILIHLKSLKIKDFKDFSFIYKRFGEIFDLKYEKFGDFEKLKNTPLLVIDEFLTLNSFNRKDIDNVVHDIIDARVLACKKTILISNVSLKSIEEMVEGSVFSRLKNFKKIHFKGVDRRGEKNV